MIDRAAGDGDVSRTLGLLSHLGPREVNVDRRVVFSLGPSLWTHVEKARWQKDEVDTVVIDLSELLAVNSAMQLPEMDIQARILEELTGAGWPRRLLVSQYRSDLKSHLITDVAVFDDDSTLRMALEVKHPTGRPIDEDFVRVNAQRESTAQWFCLTDGRQYHLLNRRSGSYRVLEEAPSPESLKVPVVGEYLSAGPGHHPPSSTKRPSTPEEFVSLVADLEPQAMTIDPSVVVMRRSMGHPNTTAFWSAVEMSREMLSDDSYAHMQTMSRQRLDIYRLLLVWAASLSSVKTLSTVDDPHFTTSPGERQLRRYVFDRLRLCGVLEMPPGLYSGLTSYAFSLLYFGGNRDTVYFDVLTSRGDLARYETRQWFASISAWMDGKEYLTGYTTRLDGASPWTFSANSPEVSESIERLGRLGELSTIGELCLISRTGGPYKGREFANTSMGHDPRLEPDDILMPETVGQRSNHAVRVGEATRSRERHLVLRPVDERVSVDFLVEYLNSPTARQLISATAVGRFGGAYNLISTEALRNLPVPMVDDASADSFDRVRRVEAQLRAKVEEMEALRISLFEARGTQDFKTRLSSLARVGEMMSASMEQVERQQFQIANFYPFPIAFGYRLLGSQVGPRATYEAQLRMAENMLAFVASVSLALVQEQDREESGVNLRELWKGGVSAGGWKEAIRLCSKVFTSYKNYPLAAAINGLRVSSEKNESFGGDVKELIKQRNYLHHGGGGPATPEEFQKAAEDLGMRLQRCMQRLNFFTEYPIREVQDLDVSRYSAEARLTCLRYVGDHPGLAQEELVFPRPLPKGDLFIDLGGENWVPLHPFVSVKVCPNCRTREIYFIDKWEDGRIKLKSFERGHTERDPGMVQDLEVWPHWEPQTQDE